MSRTGYADVLLGYSVYRHHFFGGIHVAQNIPVRHGLMYLIILCLLH